MSLMSSCLLAEALFHILRSINSLHWEQDDLQFFKLNKIWNIKHQIQLCKFSYCCDILFTFSDPSKGIFSAILPLGRAQTNSVWSHSQSHSPLSWRGKRVTVQSPSSHTSHTQFADIKKRLIDNNLENSTIWLWNISHLRYCARGAVTDTKIQYKHYFSSC